MHVVRTIIWVLLLVALAAFSVVNWEPVTLRVWDGVLIDTMLPGVVILAFALGFIPMWLVHRAAKWQWRRRVTALEAAARAMPVPAAPALAPASETPLIEPVPETLPEPMPEPVPEPLNEPVAGEVPQAIDPALTPPVHTPLQPEDPSKR